MKIIVALDYTNPLDALEMAAKLRHYVDGFKTNHTLWSQSVYIKDYTEKIDQLPDADEWNGKTDKAELVSREPGTEE